ncbi:DMT family transporter [Brevibacillus sp. SYP-B805]|uniref:DMT family transporter n=1 Tax=Brevibacillus sp. SYP-B805 TaxID=1578199 RepID=UPI0013EB4978|nr:DMT family transporter [Brevibacillus sp. SYP-B805]NGQ94351.1 DMT family transporter [Brevibacillus sp. SYP-B805]
MGKKQLVADLVLLLIAFIWGATFLVVQNAVSTLPPNTFNGVRFTIASLFLALILLLFARHERASFNRQLVKNGMFVGLWLFAGYALQTMGLVYTTPSKAGFITGLSVVLVPLFSFLFLRERIKWPAVAGVLIAVAGLYLLTLGESPRLNTGDLLVFGCAISFALQIVFTGKYAPHHPPLPLAIVQLASVALFSWIYAFFLEEWQLAFDMQAMLSPEVAWGLFITAIPATALAFLAQTAFQQQTSSTRVALIFAMEPVFAALSAYLWIDELLTGRQILGCALIFAGMILAELPVGEWLRRKRPAASRQETG